MCARFELNANARELRIRFSLVVDPDRTPGPVIRPTDELLAIASDRKPQFMKWGLQVSWSPRPLINARSESLQEKAVFKAMLGNRLLVPATAYIEWRDTGVSSKVRYRIAPVRNSAFSMAGLTDGRRVVILTCAPAAPVADIHSRMPVIFPDAASEDSWLQGSRPEELLLPYPGPIRAQADEDPPRAQGELFA